MLIWGNFRDVQTCLHLRRVQFLACTACRVAIRLDTLAREGLGHGLVVPFPAYGFALWFRIMSQTAGAARHRARTCADRSRRSA